MAQLQRPSTILILLAFAFSIYTRSVTRLTAMAVIFAFLLRQWEGDAVADNEMKEVDVEKAHDDVLAADSSKETSTRTTMIWIN